MDNSLYHRLKRAAESTVCSPLEFFATEILDIITYDDAMDTLFVTKTLEVYKAITYRTTFAYVEHAENYLWFLIMCNTPFFADRITWGTSIRGAWWTNPLAINLGGWGQHTHSGLIETMTLILNEVKNEN